MYETPIKLMQRQLEIREENGILNAIKEVGVVVDKEELIKALQYDRGQYDKGYSDGIKEFVERFDVAIDEKIGDAIKALNPHLYLAKMVAKDIVKEMTEGAEEE